MDEQRARFEEIYRRCEQPVLAYASRRASAEAARDAVAEAFVAAWRRVDELPDDPLPWLIAATRRTLANQRRASTRQARLADKLAAAGAGVTVDPETVENPLVRGAFHRLSPADRETLALLAWDGLTPTQAARSLGCSPVAFRVRAHRARGRFERALRQEAELDRLELKEAS